jgi:thyroid stimulating hormone receptor
VFASQLSIFTLTIITIERWFAITKAIFLTKRLNRRNATFIMIFGYVFSIILASLPLLGVSNYSSTSICLPMRAEFTRDVIYLLTLLAASGIGFSIMVICYLHIYFHLHIIDVAQGSVFNRETAATKKMALLVSFWGF